MTPRRSLILEVGVDAVFHTILLLSLFLLFVGHNAPGGGFIGGLVAGSAFVLRYVSGAVPAVRAGTRLAPTTLFGSGLLLALVTGLVPTLLGDAFLQSAIFELELPVLGDVKVVTALFFDMGVYLVVLGLVLTVLTVLGDERLEPSQVEPGREATP